MVLLVEVLLGVTVLVGVYRMATGHGDPMTVVEPDRSPGQLEAGPLTAEELVAMRIPLGVGYRKIDVDRLLDRVAAQLPHAEPGPAEPAAQPVEPVLQPESPLGGPVPEEPGRG
jgi:hypothetical protein